jgi:phosphopantothenoylcysteine decarboxylase/phosphopantothenate--cysteine ligase
MHTEMWEHPSVQDNVDVLERRGVEFVQPETWRLAGGDSGEGRLADPSLIAERALALVGLGASSRGDLAGRRIVVSAGGTREPIDPVRFLSNRSSGKQGHAVAEAAVRRGASVTLVTSSALPLAADVAAVVNRIDIESAAQMEAALSEACREADVVVMAAAVADFRPKAVAGRKISKDEGVPDLVLEPTPDILVGLVAHRPPGQIVVGFAAETNDVLERGREKLARKGVDLLVVNDVSAPGTGFDHDTNAVSILDADGSVTEVPLTSKDAVANAVLDRVIAHQREM